MTSEEACVFCEIVAGAAPASLVIEDAEVLAFMNRAQFNDGHVLVIRKQHRPDIRDFEPELGAAIMRVVSEVARAVTAAFEPAGITIRHNVGDAGGQDVFHAHFHVITRQDADGLHRAYPASPPHPPREELDTLAARIRDHLPPP